MVLTMAESLEMMTADEKGYTMVVLWAVHLAMTSVEQRAVTKAGLMAHQLAA